MLRAGPIRLRPILMTSIATLMAAVPGALGRLVSSTMLSLLLMSAFYVVPDGVRVRAAGLIRRRKRPASEKAPAHPS
jgi:hypothetical protein